MGHPQARDLFGMSCIMSEEECQKVIAAGKRSKEAFVPQVAREVLRSNSSSPSIWQYLEELLTGIVSEARHMAGEELGAEKATTELLQELGARTLELERARTVVAKLHAELDTTRAERDEARDDAKDAVLAKQDLEPALEEAKREATGLQLQKLDVGAYIRLWTPRKWSSRLSLSHRRRRLCGSERSWTGSSLEAEGDADGQVSGPAYSEHQGTVKGRDAVSGARPFFFVSIP
ncbi:hypothetical protein ACLOJK_034677 [Asimina triloba]